MKTHRDPDATSTSLHYFAEINQKIRNMKAAGAEIIHLDIGSPDLPPPDIAIRTLTDSASDPAKHGYQSHNWTADYRRAWARFYQETYQAALDPEQEILPLIGSKEGIFHLPLAIIKPGEVVLVPDPGYITYTRGAQIAGGQVQAYPLSPDNSYLPDLEKIPREVLAKSRLMWVNYPHNPTGATVNASFFSRLVEFAHRHKILLCHDAAYTQISFTEKPFPSLLQIPGAMDVAIEFNTLSKSHAMAGWRVAVAAGNANALKQLFSVKSHADSGHFLPIIEAATAALNETQPAWIQERNQTYQERRDVLFQTLQELSLQTFLPAGGLYLWARVPSGFTSAGFARQLLESAHLSIAPGVIFGKNGEGFVRLALTAPTPQIQEASQRLKEWMKHASPLSHRR
jgi:LL-diaminopimelate aminotransferase